MFGLNDLKNSVVQSTVTQAILGVTAVILILRYVTKKKYNLPPGPCPLPILGNILAFRNVDLYKKLDEWHKQYGSVIMFYAGSMRIVVINEINELTEAFVKRGSDFSGRPFLHSVEMLTDGFKDIALTTYGDQWKYQRKIAVHALRQYLTGTQLEERVHESVTSVIENMLTENEAFDPHTHISLCVFNIIHGLCFGSTFQLDDPLFKHLLSTFDESNDLIGNGFIEDFFMPLQYWPTKKFRSVKEYVENFNNYMYKCVADHNKSFDENDMRSLTDNVILAQRQFLAEGGMSHTYEMTDMHVGQIMADMFGAGVDTTRTQLDWIFFVMAARPDIQAKVQNEIKEVVGDRVPGKEHRSKLVYLEAVMLEAMRLFNVAPIGLPHSTLCDTTVGGYDIPANTLVIANQNCILLNQDHWDEPMTFKPERFLDETQTRIVLRHQSWIPFSMGQRACLGESLAKLEMVYVIAGLMQKLTFSLDPGSSPELKPNPEGLLNRPMPFKVMVIVSG